MPDISIHTIDKLHHAFIRLETITYLQTLVSAEIPEDFAPSGGMNDGKENAPDFLLDLQTEAVADLRSLLFGKSFCCFEYTAPDT